jgi:hypothetical protein
MLLIVYNYRATKAEKRPAGLKAFAAFLFAAGKDIRWKNLSCYKLCSAFIQSQELLSMLATMLLKGGQYCGDAVEQSIIIPSCLFFYDFCSTGNRAVL